MRVFPIDVEIELAVTASSFEEAKEVVLAGLKDGRYAKDAKICYNGSAVDKYGRLKAFEGERVRQYAHGDELKRKGRRKGGG